MAPPARYMPEEHPYLATRRNSLIGRFGGIGPGRRAICRHARLNEKEGRGMQCPGSVVPPMLAALAGMMTLAPPAVRAQAAGEGTIEGTVWRETVRRNLLQDHGEAGLSGLSVELWNTTSIAGQPVRAQSTQTNAQGRYTFVVNAFTGPLPDFGCYEVRVTLPASLGGGVARSQPICRVASGAAVSANFALPGSGNANHAPSVLFIGVEPSGTQPGGTVRLQALGLDVDDDRLTYQWSLTAGTFTNPEGPLIDWTAPNQPGNYPIWVA